MSSTSPEEIVVKRLSPRYVLSTPILGHVEQANLRYAGRILNLSEGGFALLVPKRADQPSVISVSAADQEDLGEVSHGNVTVGGFGRILNPEPTSNGVRIGFAWDEAIRIDQGGDIQQIIDTLLKDMQSGCVKTKKNAIKLVGHLSAALAGDCYVHLESAPGAVISLGECSSLDPGGVDLLLTFKALGHKIVNINPNIADILQRFGIQ